MDPTSYPLETAKFFEGAEKHLLTPDYIDYGKKLMQICQDYTKRNILATHYICDSAYYYLRKPNFNSPEINLRNVTDTCMEFKDCFGFPNLWKFINHKEVKAYLGVKPSTKFPIKDRISHVLAKSDIYRNFSSSEDVLSLIKNG